MNKQILNALETIADNQKVIADAVKEKEDKLRYTQTFNEGKARAEKHQNIEINRQVDDFKGKFLSGFCVSEVIYKGNTTIVKFSDGSVTHCTLMQGDTYDKDKGFMYCIVKKIYGVHFKEQMRKWSWNYQLELKDGKK